VWRYCNRYNNEQENPPSVIWKSTSTAQ